MIDVIVARPEFVALKISLAKILVLYFLAFMAVVVDFISGVKKSRRLGVPRSSRGYRMTVIKVNQYTLLLVLFSLIDIALTVAGAFPFFGLKNIPLFTLVAVLIVWFIEFKSVWENTDKGHQKEVRQAVGALGRLIRSREDLDEITNTLDSILKKKEEFRDNKE